MITASELYDHVACPHRVHLDAFGDPLKRDTISPFVRLLWERGSAYEAAVVDQLKTGQFSSLHEVAPDDREEATVSAIKQGTPIIYGGRISAGELLGEPDLLIRRGDRYFAADIKSGRGELGESDEGSGKLKPHYAVQVALYSDILLQLGFGVGHVAEIWDIQGSHVLYDLDLPVSSKSDKSWWDYYREQLAAVKAILAGGPTRGALASACKFCHWYTSCRSELTANRDLTLIPSLGRPLRDEMCHHVASIDDLAAMQPDALIQGNKTIIPGLGPDRLRLFHQRAQLLTNPGAQPYLRDIVELAATELEIFFDIEADPMNDIVYLHGFVERWRQDPDTEKYTAFFAEGANGDAERTAFAEAVAWLRDRQKASIYYYSKYERTMYRKLCERHLGVCSIEEIDALFAPPRSTDLYYDVVCRATEWPTYDHSIKTLAKYLGFQWRDKEPSGAASIEWYQRWIETGDPAIRQRIIDYNEDDCRATAVLLDGIRALTL